MQGWQVYQCLYISLMNLPLVQWKNKEAFEMTDYIGNYKNRPRKVVFYGRVSTEHEEQLSALENQMEWYTDLALRNPNWTVVAQYIDEGICCGADTVWI